MLTTKLKIKDAEHQSTSRNRTRITSVTTGSLAVSHQCHFLNLKVGSVQNRITSLGLRRRFHYQPILVRFFVVPVPSGTKRLNVLRWTRAFMQRSVSLEQRVYIRRDTAGASFNSTDCPLWEQGRGERAFVYLFE